MNQKHCQSVNSLKTRRARGQSLALALFLAAGLFLWGIIPARAKTPVPPPRSSAQLAEPAAGKETQAHAALKRPQETRKLKAVASKKRNPPGLKKFSPRVFRLEKPPQQESALPPSANPASAKKFSAGAAEPASRGKLGRLSLSGSMPSQPESRLDVEHSPLPGGRHTLSGMEYDAAPEMSMSVKMSRAASARLTLNPQDEASPLYSPIVNDDGISATGLYFDLDMNEDMQLQLGGEVRSASPDSLGSTEEESAGASVGLRWNF
ncbi:MAG: hypothetical protein LBJ82_04395 [Deltaproteobacteria bacterium]|nr:hypothetical protein [Deltaproteobacteria bacterium]